MKFSTFAIRCAAPGAGFMVRKSSSFGAPVSLGMVTTGALAPSVRTTLDWTSEGCDASAPPARKTRTCQRRKHEIGNRCGTKYARGYMNWRLDVGWQRKFSGYYCACTTAFFKFT